MKSGVTVRQDLSALVLARIQQLVKNRVLVGVPSDKANRDDGMEINNAELAYIHSNGGTIRIPEHTAMLYRSMRPDGEFARNGRFVRKEKSNFSTMHTVPEHTVTLPPRPFLKQGVEKSMPEFTPELKKAGAAILAGKQDVARQFLERAGMRASRAAQGIIRDGMVLYPLAPSTLASRRSRGRHGIKPLYDTGILLRSITYVVESK
ncbi:hypothetical protein MVS05_000951 [Salmonella enterica]|nr:hypothetical protein [Salmonella enterica]EJA5147284.1 hypothetical protein [Salmonella enterica]EJA5988006.1 hypothetical protein [Salmonella enterica]EJU3350553.1 hypothetical protein [Salmonella enterica]EJX4290219.1 hypothetical protein [Salmonella enterica]